MIPWTERFPKAYQEWVKAGGIENNFRKHALAIGLTTPSMEDIAWILHELEIHVRQVEDALSHYPYEDPNPVPIPPATGIAADISYLTGEIDQAFCDKLKSLGVDLVIVGLQDIDLARRQLAILKNADFKLHVYIWPQDKDVDNYLPEVISIMHYFKLPCIWVDVEDSGYNVDAAITELREQRHFTTGIYTSAFMWQKYMSNTDAYQFLPLWYARYDMMPNMSDFEPFGGWDVPTMKQYDADFWRYDLNVYNPDLLP